jgi:Cd2+/Zn2+-exporting ATPase
MKKEVILDHLDCANCAAKIEQAVQGINGVSSATVDFTFRKLTFEVQSPAELDRILGTIRVKADQIEAGVQVTEIEPDQPSTLIQPPEVESLPRTKWIRLLAGLVLFAIAWIGDFPGLAGPSLFAVSYLLIGFDVLNRAALNIRRGQVFDEHFLMSLATIGAFAIQEYPEAVAVMLFYEIGEYFENRAVGHSRRSIGALMNIRPDTANLLENDELRKVAPERVAVGAQIVVNPGEKIPLDGRIIEGSSLLDTSAITGESLPREVTIGDDVFSGSINKNGRFTVQVTKPYAESTVAKILDLVQNAASKKAPTEKFITRFARYYTPAVVLIAVLLATIPPLFIDGARFTDWLYRALIFLVVSCPCALVISIPLGFFGGIGGASKRGILVKGSNYLEALNQVDTVVFDKTGTLTQGIFQVTQVVSRLSPEQDLLALAAHAESASSHPIAQSIVKAYGKPVDHSRIGRYDEKSGFGIRAEIDGQVVLAGSARYLQAEGFAVESSPALGTLVHLAVNNIYAGYLEIADAVKADARQAIDQLREIGITRIVMLTGDTEAVGQAIGRELGVDTVYAELLPDQKVEKLEQLEKAHTGRGKIAFVGDGINDAPVLARADVGIAMGGLGSDAAIEAADVVIMTDHPSKVASAILIARKTNRIVRQNIVFAFAVKAAVLLLSAGGMATLWEAVFADIGVAVLAILNATRVLKFKSRFD